MSTKHLHAFIAFALGGILLSCHSDLDVNKIDPTIELPVKVSLPVGSMTAKVADFFKTADTAQFYIDTVGGKNVLTAQYTLADQKQKIDGFDFASQISSTSFTLNLRQRLDPIKIWVPSLGDSVNLLQGPNKDSIIVPAEVTAYSDSLEFPMPMALTGINKPTTTLRVDKATLPEANFEVTIDRNQFNDLDWNWVDEISMELGQQFTWTGHSNHVVLYKRGDAISQFGQKITLEMTDVILNLMRDASQDPSSTNVYDSLDVMTLVKYTIPSGTKARLESTQSGIKCNFDVKKVTVEALWGWFLEAGGYSNRGVYDIDLSSLPFLERASLPIAEPRITGHLESPIAGNIKLTVDSLYTIDADGNYQFANFNGSRKGVFTYDETNGCINPQTSALTDLAKLEIGFDHTPEKGHIDSLFLKMPKKVGYNLNLNIDETTCKQVRVVADNLYATFGAHARVPFEFNKGLLIDYTDSLKDISIAKYQIDSLLSDVKGVDSVRVKDLWLYLGFENGIPLNVWGTFVCLDSLNNVIMDPQEPTKPYTIIPEQDTIRLAGGTYQAGTKTVVPTATPIACRVTQEHLNLFPKIKTIVYTFGVNDESLKDSQFGAEIKGSDNLKVQIGLTGDIKAVLDVTTLGK
ncbi:MAG: hypothetical protein IJS82_04030 [Paludibacteraceae bacterium]|nr:hypothetical protein [Paludibacteraceae bacterium]